MRLGVLLMSLMSFTTSKSDTFTMGYLTGSQRLPGDLEYQRPGLTISGAISLAVDEVNRDILGPMGHKLDFIVAETYGVEKISVKETADLRVRNVSVYIGPQETCEHEAYLAASFNLPMISYVVLLYLKSSDSEFGHIATIILHSLHAVGVTVVAARSWDTPYHHEYAENPFHKLVEDTYRDTRREYFVIGVDINQYDKQNPTAYFRGLLREENDPEAPKAFRNYIGVVASSPVGFENFTNLVNSYMVKEPFNFPNPLKVIGQGKKAVLAGKPIGIPTKQEQVNLLTNVEEVFESIKSLTSDEGKMTILSVSEDIEKNIQRSRTYLSIFEEFHIFKLEHLDNQNCTRKKKKTIQKNTREYLILLKNCGAISEDEIKNSSSQVFDVINSTLVDGQNFLDSLRNCAFGPVLQLIPCYRKVIQEQVVPLKEKLLQTTEIHRNGMLRSISIRRTASDCIDDLLQGYKEKVSCLLDEAMSCG
ncbi:guanylyl cyclase [Holotrichia oblita]|uniref:Guanylyl cyclase n=1 Tax=Holotrichia oblita TaxID=644536 RepID=A0ACB9T2X8_HOLOL|nr:guanylyl cyclase [Holotrichia oblita]